MLAFLFDLSTDMLKHFPILEFPQNALLFCTVSSLLLDIPKFIMTLTTNIKAVWFYFWKQRKRASGTLVKYFIMASVILLLDPLKLFLHSKCHNPRIIGSPW